MNSLNVYCNFKENEIFKTAAAKLLHRKIINIIGKETADTKNYCHTEYWNKCNQSAVHSLLQIRFIQVLDVQ